MAAGEFLMFVHTLPFFYAGLTLIAIGTGLLKPNVSAMVGQLYGPGDVRRDSGFSIYYMGINIGALLAPLVCGWIAESAGSKGLLASLGADPARSWHFAFAAAGRDRAEMRPGRAPARDRTGSRSDRIRPPPIAVGPTLRLAVPSLRARSLSLRARLLQVRLSLP